MHHGMRIGTGAAIAILLAVAGHQVLAQPASPPPAAAPAPGRGGANPDPAAQLSMPVATAFTSKIGFFTAERDPGASYPRVIQLKFGANKGTLLATYGHRGTLPIWRSTDNGETWTKLSDVPQLSGQPCLYELPSRMGEFPAGTVMACGIGTRRTTPTPASSMWRSAAMAARPGIISAPSSRAIPAPITPPLAPAFP